MTRGVLRPIDIPAVPACWSEVRDGGDGEQHRDDIVAATHAVITANSRVFSTLRVAPVTLAAMNAVRRQPSGVLGLLSSEPGETYAGGVEYVASGDCSELRPLHGHS